MQTFTPARNDLNHRVFQAECTSTLPFRPSPTLWLAQSVSPGFYILFGAILFFSGCGKSDSRIPTARSGPATIACLVPAATDLIVGMGAKSHLVAVSTQDLNRGDVGMLPKAGDYSTIDWELLRSLHPSVLITQIASEKQPAGFNANAAELHIQAINLKIETLNDILSAVDQLGEAAGEPLLAKTAHQQMRDRLDAVAQRTKNLPTVRTLIVTGDDARFCAGVGTYLDDLLKIAGGVNVVSVDRGHWASIETESLILELKPDVILQLMPDAQPQVRKSAEAFWQQHRQIPAVANGRVYGIYDGYAELPGWHVPDLAEKFAEFLHPSK